jgi:cyclopropane-fatty-acyl-phospholipid synthase
MHPLRSLAKRAVTARLSGLRHGRLTVRHGDHTASWGESATEPVVVDVHDERFYAAVALGGAVGAGEAYAHGWWSTTNLTAVVRLLLRNRDVLEGLERGWARLLQPARRLAHALRANTRGGSRRNIRAHYDLSNPFFESFLDETLTYSCALFERPGTSLRDAQLAKYARIAALLDLQADDRVVEIGCGWGGFALYAAAHHGCHVTATTISEQQYRVAVERVALAGLADRIRIVRQDYRDLEGRFDKLVSIEMIEAVGHDFFPTFFERCAGLLGPHGRAAIQAIIIEDTRYEAARREVDFIKRHIFPGSCIPSLAVLRQAVAWTDLSLVRTDAIGLHYAETLRRWRDNLQRSRQSLRGLGFDDRFQRLWEFYFCYCEGGFLERAIDTVQLVLTKPAVGSIPCLPAPAISPLERVA